MECILFDDIVEWEFWAHPRGGSDLCYRYPPTKIALAIRQREKLLRDDSIVRVEPIVAVIAQLKEKQENYTTETILR